MQLEQPEIPLDMAIKISPELPVAKDSLCRLLKQIVVVERREQHLRLFPHREATLTTVRSEPTRNLRRYEPLGISKH